MKNKLVISGYTFIKFLNTEEPFQFEITCNEKDNTEVINLCKESLKDEILSFNVEIKELV